jgi:hypothetical protein
MVRLIATGIRAGADRVLIIHREELSPIVETALRNSKLLIGLRALDFVSAPQFEPEHPISSQKIAAFIDDEVLWLPWNWVTNKHGLTSLELLLR